MYQTVPVNTNQMQYHNEREAYNNNQMQQESEMMRQESMQGPSSMMFQDQIKLLIQIITLVNTV